MRYAFLFVGVSLAFAALLTSSGCGTGEGEPAGQSPDGATFLLADEPAGAIEVTAARKQIKKDDEEKQVVIVGKIPVAGKGAPEPWSKTHAVFTIADPSAAAHKHEDGEECHFCAKSRADSMAIVKIVGANDEVVKTDARKLLGINENQIVVARGRAKYNESGDLEIRADGIFVRK